MLGLTRIFISVFCVVSRCAFDTVLGVSLPTHVFKERSDYSSNRSDIEKQDRAAHDHPHEVVFVIRQKNMDELTSILHDISDPHSLNYGQHWTRDEVIDFTSNGEGRDAVVSYLHMNGASVVAETLAGEYITAKASIKVWEKMFNTKFFSFVLTHRDKSIQTVIRAEHYSIPTDLNKHVASVFNTVEILDQLFKSRSAVPLNPKHGKFSPSEFVNITPSRLRAYYNMSRAMGSINSTQAVYLTFGQYYSPKDLSTLQELAGLGIMPAVSQYGDHANDTICLDSPNSCGEGNLDMQYITTMSPMSPTTFWYVVGSLTAWLKTVADTMNPPKVISISYTFSVSGKTASSNDAFTAQAIKLGTMGVTIVVAAGDHGAGRADTCGYNAAFPASSPYVLSVGGTTVS